MSETDDKDSKSEEPTEKKISDALEKGNVPFSKEVSNAASVLVVLLLCYFILESYVAGLVTFLTSLMANIDEWPLGNGGDVVNIGNAIGLKLFMVVMPLILPLLAIGLISSFSQNKPRMVPDRIRPKLERISIKKGFGRMLGWHGFKEFLKSLFKFSSAGFIGVILFYSQSDWLFSHLLIDPTSIPYSINSMVIQMLLLFVLLMAGLAGVDFVWTKREWISNLRMTHQEIKDERRQSEGDPMVKMRNQSIAKDRARKRMISQVDNATLVIANPTHFAVALRYKPESDRAPVVLAKGQDVIALKIRKRAEEHLIPVIEDKPLARALHKVATVDAEIPIEFYVPIAKIVRAISDKERQKKHGSNLVH